MTATRLSGVAQAKWSILGWDATSIYVSQCYLLKVGFSDPKKSSARPQKLVLGSRQSYGGHHNSRLRVLRLPDRRRVLCPRRLVYLARHCSARGLTQRLFFYCWPESTPLIALLFLALGLSPSKPHPVSHLVRCWLLSLYHAFVRRQHDLLKDNARSVRGFRSSQARSPDEHNSCIYPVSIFQSLGPFRRCWCCAEDSSHRPLTSSKPSSDKMFTAPHSIAKRAVTPLPTRSKR